MAIPWIPMLTLGAQLIGGLMGQKESSSSSQNTNTVTSGSTTQLQNLLAESQQTQQSNTNQTSTDVGSTTATGAVDRLDATTKDKLTQAVQGLLGSVGSSSQAAQQQLESLMAPGNAFDSDAFVNGIMSSARAGAASDLESSIGQLRNRIGAGSGGNSAAALLEAKLRSQSTANLAGIEQQARGQAAQLSSNDASAKAGAIASLGSTQQNELTTLLSSLLNSTERTTQQQQQQSTGTTVGTTNQTSSEKSKQAQSSSGATEQTQNQSTNTSASGQKQDFTKLFQTFADAFSTGF